MTEFGLKWIGYAVDRPRRIVWGMVGITVALAVLAGLPTLLPGKLGPLHGATVDTDPENMLSADEPVRVFHRESKARFGLHDGIVVGVVPVLDAFVGRLDRLELSCRATLVRMCLLDPLSVGVDDRGVVGIWVNPENLEWGIHTNS